nr:substrate-binding domain-containing protein [Stappia taiwanensis]
MKQCRPHLQHALLAIAFLVLSLPLPTQAGTGPRAEYWDLEDFLATRPEQPEIASRFHDRVQGPGQRVTQSLPPVRIAAVYPGKQASDYWRRSIESFTARLDEIGLRYELDSHFTAPATEVRLQMQYIGEALKSDPDYLVFTLDAFRHRSIIERLIARGRPKVILQNITTPLRAWSRNQPFLYVGFDHATGTRTLVQHYLAHHPEAERYAIFYGSRGYVSHARGETFRLAMAGHPSKTLSTSYFVGFDRESAHATARTLLLEDPELSYIFSCSTDIALGVLDAIRELGREGQVHTNGWGGGSAELEQIAKGALEATVMRMNDDNGVAMAEAISLDLQGRGHEVPQVYSGDFALITSRDDPQRIETLKRKAFRYSQ